MPDKPKDSKRPREKTNVIKSSDYSKQDGESTKPVRGLQHADPHPDTVLENMISEDCIAIVIEGHQEVLEHDASNPISLGRKVDESSGPDLDMAPYGGIELGVSRHHATITLQNDGCIIQDMNSTNGTWLNGVRMSPFQEYKIKPGDHVRLGQLVLFVYFNVEQSSPHSRVIALKYRQGLAVQPKQGSLSPIQLLHIVGPFLNALSQIQSIVNDWKGRDVPPVVIDAITADPLTVTISAAQDALQIVQEKVVAWEISNTDLIEQAFHDSDALATNENERLQTMLAGIKDPLVGNNLQAQLGLLLGQLADDVAASTAPDKSAGEGSELAAALVPHLADLIFSGITLLD